MKYDISAQHATDPEGAIQNSGAEYVAEGTCALDALVGFVRDMAGCKPGTGQWEELRGIDELSAEDDGASVYAGRTGERSFEVHVQIDGVDQAFVLDY